MRIVQEAVLNAITHGKPNNITVKSCQTHLDIIDDGSGFDPTQPPRRHNTNSGIGLKGMKTRAETLRAKLNVTSNTEGTKIRLEW